MITAVTLLFLLIFFLLVLSREPIAAFKPWLDWFDEWDPERRYREFISPTLMAYYFSSKFMYSIAKLCTREDVVFERDWYIDFLLAVMRAQARGMVDGEDAVLTPRHLYESIVPADDDGDAGEASSWKNRISIGTSPVQVGDRTLTPSEDLTNRWPKNVEEWRILMCARPELGGWGCSYNADSKTWNKNNDWVYDEGSSYSSTYTNFLSRYSGVPESSSLVIGFVTQERNWSQGVILAPDAMNQLLGIPNASGYVSRVGGWYGFLKNGDNWSDFEDLSVQSYVWASVLQPRARDGAGGRRCNSIRSAAAGVGGGVTGGLLFSTFLHSATRAGSLAAAPGPGLMALAVTAGFLIFGAATGALDASAQGCFS